jgi:hypothetical protein
MGQMDEHMKRMQALHEDSQRHNSGSTSEANE